MKSLATLLFAATVAAQEPCYSIVPDGTHGPLTISANSFSATWCCYAEFVPTGNGIALLTMHLYTQAHPTAAELPLLNEARPSCPLVPMDVIGWWWWEPTAAARGHVMRGPFAGAPSVDLAATPLGLVMAAGPMAEGARTGVVVDRGSGCFECPPVPHMVAYLVAPRGGQW